MNRRNFLKSMGAASLAATVSGFTCVSGKKAYAAASKKTNVILILVDDFGWADIGCYCQEFGNDYYESPNIDRLRSEGMKFTDAYASCCVCSPTRASVMTGRYPTRSGITNWIGSSNPSNREYICPTNTSKLPLGDVTIPEILGPAGYATCHVGKWHLGDSGYLPENQGFDENIGGCHWGHPKKGYFSPYQFPSNANLPDGPNGQYLTDREGQESVDFIQSAHDANKPFFLYMSHYTVHRPTQAKQSDIDYFAAKAKPSNSRYKSLKPAYAAMIKSLDEAVGGILDKLDSLGIADDTAIIFTSDNGGLLPDTVNYPLKGGKAEHWEGGIRVPLLVKWPGIVAPNSLSAEPTISVDLLPTICEMANIRVPNGVTIDGQSIVSVLKQKGSLKRDSLFWHYPHYNHDLPATTIRSKEWKLIKRYGGNKEFELFNLKNDISETTDLAAQFPGKVKELNEKLLAWLRHTNAKMPVKNPNHPGNADEKKKIQLG
ncbi:MAG: sulfatase-like hydrolase/transferase [Phycisphaerae bacterium]|nr:sulfatase-like hydrolase/transferase [Phycisphaerae bacterium]